MSAQYLIILGLICDIFGALLVANEVVNVFREPVVLERGGFGSVNSGFEPQVNPRFVVHEKRKRRYMSYGLALLLLGFGFQIWGTWLSS